MFLDARVITKQFVCSRPMRADAWLMTADRGRIMRHGIADRTPERHVTGPVWQPVMTSEMTSDMTSDISGGDDGA